MWPGIFDAELSVRAIRKPEGAYSSPREYEIPFLGSTHGVVFNLSDDSGAQQVIEEAVLCRSLSVSGGFAFGGCGRHLALRLVFVHVSLDGIAGFLGNFVYNDLFLLYNNEKKM